MWASSKAGRQILEAGNTGSGIGLDTNSITFDKERRRRNGGVAGVYALGAWFFDDARST
jgi:hypothetical protein